MSVFDYFKKADFKKTPFDLSNHAPYTCKLGELLPTYLNDTMAGEEWKLSISESIKTAPLVAPSLLKLSNNSYGFFTPNSTIWEHWNDFVTNNAMVQDTVISSHSHSDIDSQWKIPSIPANILQIALKIAGGYAFPYVRFNAYDTISSTSSTGVVRPNTPPVDSISSSANHVYPNGLWLNTLDSDKLVIVETDKVDEIAVLANDYLISQMSNGSYDAYCASRGMTSYFVKDNIWVDLFFYSDEYSQIPSTVDTPVKVQEYDCLCELNRNDGGTVAKDVFSVKGLDFILNQRYFKKTTRKYMQITSLTDDNIPIDSTFRVDLTSSARGTLSYKYSDSYGQLPELKLSRSLMEKEFIQQISGGDFVLNNDALYRMLAEPLRVAIQNYRGVNSSNIGANKSIVILFNGEPVATIGDSSMNLGYVNGVIVLQSIFGTDNFSYDKSHSSSRSIRFPMTPVNYQRFSYDTTDPDISPSGHFSVLDDAVAQTECLVAGYTPTAWLYYLCQKVVRLCDYMEIVTEPLITRSFATYANVEYNALPFMAYSKIWSDYFRNSNIQSPELCYKDVNGLMFIDEDMSNELSVRNLNGETNYYEPNYWCIPIHTRPLDKTDGVYPVIKIDSWQKAFSLVTGFEMFRHLMNFEYGYKQNYDAIFMPSYYNSLCGVKYKNISRSIFTAGQLDPTNGAKIEEIPDTIIELRHANKLQEFWETTALAKTVKRWYQSVFGSTPSHDNYDSPLLLGKSSSDIKIGEILQQSQTTDTSALGDRAGVALGGGKGGICKHFFNEHGFVMILSSVTMDISFCDGEQQYIHPVHSYLDLPYTQFSNLGNQSLPNRLVSAYPPPCIKDPTDWQPSDSDSKLFLLNRDSSQWYGKPDSPVGNATWCHYTSALGRHNLLPNGSLHAWNMQALPIRVNTNSKHWETSDYFSSPFSYVPRYAEYKIKLDKCHGEFRNVLSHWVDYQRIFSAVAFTHFFVTWEFRCENMDIGRYFVSPTEDYFYIDRYNHATVIRPLSYSSKPSL